MSLVTAEELARFTDKASRNAEERALYESTDDYIAAYAAHTDLRVRRDGPALAIGGQWEEHGPLQLRFLIAHGLAPSSHLLDLGCGTGRFARHVVPFLDAGRYTGLDISPAALDHARRLAIDEGWADRAPSFHLGGGRLGFLKARAFDMIWAHSVFTHLPPSLIAAVLGDLSQMRFGQFLYTYKRRPAPLRTGLKQFGYPPEFLQGLAEGVGLRAEALPDRWPQGQSCMRIWRP